MDLRTHGSRIANDRLEPSWLLETAVGITGGRNIDEIRRSLIATAFDLFPMRSIVFYEVVRSEAGPVINESLRAAQPQSESRRREPELRRNAARGLSPWGAMQSCLDSQRPATENTADGSTREYFPVVAESRLIEVVAVAAVGRLADTDERVLEALVRLYTNFISLIHEKELDTLTGVLNRRAFDNHLQDLMRSAALVPPPAERSEVRVCWWLAMLDVDHFKRINDCYGHLIGDEVLLLVAGLIRHSIRSHDLVFRYGGEEFAVLLAPTAPAEAVEIVERIRSAIAARRFPQAGHVTVSAGMVGVDHYDHVANIIGRADQALYYAKRHGRDRVCVYPDLVRSGEINERPPQPGLELF